MSKKNKMDNALFLVIIIFILSSCLIFIFSKPGRKILQRVIHQNELSQKEDITLEFGDWVNPSLQNDIIEGEIKKITFNGKKIYPEEVLAEVLISVNLSNYYVNSPVENIETKILVMEDTVVSQEADTEANDIEMINPETLKENDYIVVKVEENFNDILRIAKYTAIAIQKINEDGNLYGERLEFSEAGEIANSMAKQQVLSGEIKDIKKNEKGEIGEISIEVVLGYFFKEIINPIIVKKFIVTSETEFYEGFYQEKYPGKKTDYNHFQEGVLVFFTAEEDFREILKSEALTLLKIKKINNREIFEKHLKEGTLVFED